MGQGCKTASKYFLLLFNLIFFLVGGVIMGFGLWFLLDNESFVVILNNSTGVNVACYVLIGVGGFSMLMGILGCVGAIYEVRCLLGLYFACLLFILIAQITVGVLMYIQKETVNSEMSGIVTKVMNDYTGNNATMEQAWDFVQDKMSCCGWSDHQDWISNMIIINSSLLLFPCSCQNTTLSSTSTSNTGFCEAQTPDWPVYDKGCSDSVENWLITNFWVVLGICLAVAFIELLGMSLSICLCRNVQTEEYTKVPKY